MQLQWVVYMANLERAHWKAVNGFFKYLLETQKTSKLLLLFQLVNWNI